MGLAISLAFYLALVGLFWLIFHRSVPAIQARTLIVLRRIIEMIVTWRRFRPWFERRRSQLDRIHPYRRVILIAFLGLSVAWITGNAFFEIAEQLRSQSDSLAQIDQRFYAMGQRYRSESATTFFTFFTLLGSPAGLGVIIAIVVVELIVRKQGRWAAYILFTTLGGWLLNAQLKHFFARARPDLEAALRGAYGYSFPSGHAMMSFVTFATLSYVAIRRLRNWNAVSFALAFSAATVLAVSISRIYLGVHWISDIAAGWSAGAIWVAASTVAYETMRRVTDIRKQRAGALSSPAASRSDAKVEVDRRDDEPSGRS